MCVFVREGVKPGHLGISHSVHRVSGEKLIFYALRRPNIAEVLWGAPSDGEPQARGLKITSQRFPMVHPSSTYFTMNAIIHRLVSVEMAKIVRWI